MNQERNDALKDYVEVNVRIEKFRQMYPNGRIVTDILSNENGIVIMKSSVYRDASDAVPSATGHAYEKEGSTFINRTSYIENCYHRDTDVLTESGWKRITELTMHDRIGQVDLLSNELIFSYPKRLIEQPEQSFLRIEDNLTCQVVTPEHFVIIDNVKVKATEVVALRDGKPQTYRFKHDLIHDPKEQTLNETNGFVRLLQWIIADGFVDFEKHHIKFGFAKRRKFDRLVELLEQEEIPYTTSFNPENALRRINIKAEDARRFILHMPGRKTVNLELALSMNREQAEAFLEEIQWTDGYLHKDGIYLRQTDREYFDNLNLIALKAGYSVASPVLDTIPREGKFPNAMPMYRARYKRDVGRTAVQVTHLSGTDTAYCVQTETGTVVTRFGHKITVSSNCETSAVGRALAILGFEIRKSVASKEEVANAKLQQQQTEPRPEPPLESVSTFPSDAQLKMLSAKLAKCGYVKGDIQTILSVIGEFLGYPIKQLTDIKKQDITRLAEFLTSHKKGGQT